MPPNKKPITEPKQETTTAVLEPEPTSRYKGTITDKESLQYGLPEFIRVDGKFINVEAYVMQCLTPIKTDTKRKDRDQMPIYSISFNTADMDLDTRKFTGPDDAPVFLGLPWFPANVNVKTMDVHTQLVARGVIKADSPETWPKLTLIYRDVKGQRGKKRTNCCVYMREEE